MGELAMTARGITMQILQEAKSRGFIRAIDNVGLVQQSSNIRRHSFLHPPFLHPRLAR
jgi:hypothetical protein